jgi:hypothetical protein
MADAWAHRFDTRASFSDSPCTYTMPKTLVLFHGNPDVIAATADAIAEGVRSVRFAEVDVRHLAGAGEAAQAGRHRALADAAELAPYDGLVLVTEELGSVPAGVGQLVTEAGALRQQKALGTSVGSAFVAGVDAARGEDGQWQLLRALGALGLVLVPASGRGLEGARQLGHRVAHVVSWITHAKSHHHH